LVQRLAHGIIIKDSVDLKKILQNKAGVEMVDE